MYAMIPPKYQAVMDELDAGYDGKPWTAEQKDKILRLVGSALRDNPSLATDNESLKKFTRNVALVATQREGRGRFLMGLPNSKTKDDFFQTLVSAGLVAARDQSKYGVFYETYLSLRQNHPTGRISADMLYRAFFGKSLPDSVKTGSADKVSHAFDDEMDKFIDNKLVKSGINDENMRSNIGFEYVNYMASGMKLDVILERIIAKNGSLRAIGLNDFYYVPTLQQPDSDSFSIQQGFDKFAGDFNRQEPPSTIIIHGDGVDPYRYLHNEMVSEHDKTYMQSVKDIEQHVRSLCGENAQQLRTVVWTLSQSGMPENMQQLAAPLTGRRSGGGEHSALTWDFTRQANGDILLRAKSPDNYRDENGNPLCRFIGEFVIHPDGTSETKQFLLDPQAPERHRR